MFSLGQKIELLKVVAHPIRIRILEELEKGVKCVSDLEDFLELRQPNISHSISLCSDILESLTTIWMEGSDAIVVYLTHLYNNATAVIPVKTGIQKQKNWIPDQVRNDKK
jgi:DNA-binding transcriptional ArsR family regulator